MSVRGVEALFVLASLSVGGSESKTVRLANALAQRGVRSGIAYLNAPHELRAAVAPDVPVQCLERRGKFSMRTVGALRKLIEQQRPRTVFAVNLYPALYVSLATLGLRDRPRTAGLINTMHFPPGETWKPGFYRPFFRLLDQTIYGCEAQRAHWVASHRYPRERTRVIYNGVDADHFDPDLTQPASFHKRYGVSQQAFVVGTVGRLAPEKNQAVLIDAVAALRRRSIDAHLLLVGEGALREALERRAAEQQVLQHVTFAGVQRDVREALALMDVFVLPSTHVETFSNAALEAMAMRKPVVLGRIGGAQEMVREGVEGVTLPPADLAASLVQTLEALHAGAERRMEMGRAARRRVLQLFSFDSMLRHYAALIEGETCTACEKAA